MQERREGENGTPGGHAGTSIYGELGRKGRKKEVVEVDIDVGECDS